MAVWGPGNIRRHIPTTNGSALRNWNMVLRFHESAMPSLVLLKQITQRRCF
jgi:hypothetical protein